MEDHDEAYRAWKTAGLKGRTLLHLDAHIDFKWILPDPESLLQEKSIKHIESKLHEQPFWSLQGKNCEDRIHLGNYIHQAIREEIISEFIWIYPDDPDVKSQARAVGRMLQDVSLPMPNLFHLKQTEPGFFTGIFCGIPFTAAPWSALAKIHPSGKILLNIDLDFCVIQSLYGPDYPFGNLQQPSFWLSPEDFTQTLARTPFAPEMITLAYSIEEGYTPMELKFLGRELAGRLVGTLSLQEEQQFFLLKRECTEHHLERKEEIVKKLETLNAEPPSAAVSFALAKAFAGQSQWEKARRHYETAVQIDPSYRSTYNHAGPILWDRKQFAAAESSYAKMKKLDPNHPDSRLFEIKKQMRRKEWDEAVWLGKKMLEEGMDSLGVRLLTGEAYFRLKRYPEAWSLLSADNGKYFQDLRYLDFLWLKVKTAKQLNKLDDELNGYHHLRQWIPQNAGIHASLALLYLKKQNGYKARKHAWKAIKNWILGLGGPMARWKCRREVLS